MSAIVDPNTLTVGQTIRFKSISVHDNVYWTGTISGKVTYDIARAIEDVDTYYLDVKKHNPDLASKESLTYLVLRVKENDTHVVTRVFAVEWMDLATLEIVDTDASVTIKVYDVTDAIAKEILGAIQDMGYKAEIVNN